MSWKKIGMNFTTKLFEPRSKMVARFPFYLCIRILKTKEVMNDIFAKDLNGEMVSPNDAGYEKLIADIFATMKTATEMNTGYRTPEEVHEYMGRILGKPLDKSTTVLPPLYIDYGKPVTVGKGCFIQQCCTFFGRGGISIGNDVFIGPKVNLITINHDVNPDNRSAIYGRPIVIDDK